MHINFYTDATTTCGDYILQAIGSSSGDWSYQVGRIVSSVAKYYSAKQAVSADTKTVFGFKVQHVSAPKPVNRVATAGIIIHIGPNAWQVKIWWFPIQDKPVVVPYSEYII